MDCQMTLYTYSMPKLYSDAEAANRLGISIATVRRLRARGELGHLAIGRRVFVTEDQLKELLRRGRRDFTESGNGTASGKLDSAGAASRSGARRSRLIPTFNRTAEDLKQAYESAEVLAGIDDADLASCLPDRYVPPAKP